MSACKIVLKNTFGMSPNPISTLGFIEDHQVVYVCGHQAVIVNTDTKDQSFIQATTQPFQSLSITAIACSTPKKIIALAEKVEPYAAVTFFDSQSLKKKKVLQSAELGSKEIKYMAFSSDGRLCLTQGGDPEWNLLLWSVEKSAKVISVIKIATGEDTSVNQVSFCPFDSSLVVVIGKSIVRLFRIVDGQMKPISLNFRKDQSNFLSHTWLGDDKLLLGTETGEIILIQDQEFRAVIYPNSQSSSASNAEESTPILSLSPISKGFVAGTTSGELRVFEESDDSKDAIRYKLEDTYTVPRGHNLPKGHPGIIAITAISEDTIVCATDSQQLLQFVRSTSNSNVMGSGSGFDYLVTPFHGPNSSGESHITGIDIALWKPLVVTCGKDNTVRVWNIVDKRLEIMKEFSEEPTSLSIHPSGIYVVVAFEDKIRLLNILLDNLHIAREFSIRKCPEVKFSKGGQYFAAINNANVQIFSTFTGVLVSTLRGHNSRVKSIVWCNNDSQMVTVGMEGSVFFWDVYKGTRRTEQYSGSIPNDVGISLNDGSRVYTATADRTLKEITMIGKVVELPPATQESGIGVNTQSSSLVSSHGGTSKQPKEVSLQFHLSCLAMEEGRKILLGGTSEPDMPGSILSMMAAPYLSSTYDLTPLHSGPVTVMCLSRDGTLLLTGDTDGCLCISEIQSTTGGRSTTKNKDGTVGFDFMEEVLIHRQELEERKARIHELQSRVEQLSSSNEYQLRLKEMEHADKIKEITESESEKLYQELHQYEALQREKFNMEKKYRGQLSELEVKHKKELSVVENRYKAKLAAEAARHRELVAETEEMHRKWNEENQALVESHQGYLQALTGDYEEKLQEEHGMQRKLQAEKETLQVEYDIIKNNIENDADFEIDEMKARYEARLKSEEELGLGLMADHALLKKNQLMIDKETEGHKEDIRRLKEKESRLLDNIKSLEKDIQSHKKEIREREETITDKEKRIFDLKKKNQELEKFRFVLDYKIKELKLQIAPRESEIATMRKQIEEMDLELDQYHKSNAALNLMIGELKLKLKGLQKEVDVQTTRELTSKTLLERFMRDLNDAHEVRLDYRALKMKMIALFQLYVQGDVLAKEVAAKGSSAGVEKDDHDDPLQQYNRDREQMERNLDALKRSLKTDASLHKRDLAKMMRENVLLTREINDLRKDAQSLLLQQKAVDDVVQAGNKGNLVELLETYGIGIGVKRSIPPQGPADSATQRSTSSRGQSSSRHSTVKRSTALRTASADMMFSATTGHLNTRNDLRGAWKEVEMQKEQITQLEDQIKGLCASMNMDADSTLKSLNPGLVVTLGSNGRGTTKR